MPVLSKDNLKVDYSDDGEGQPVVLVHSSASGNRQWRALVEVLKDRYRVLALNLYGYGEQRLGRAVLLSLSMPKRISSSP